MKSKLLFACTLALGLTASTTADAALNAYLKLKGKSQGEIKGSVTQKGREGKIMVIAVDHQIKSPAIGKVGHGSFVVTKELDKSTPLLHKAATTGETFDFELQFWAPNLGGASGGGSEKQHYTVKLTGARIVDIAFKMQNNKDPALTRFAEQEVIAFTYDKIEWIWNDGPTMASASQ